MRSLVASWQLWAVLAAVFAAITAVLAKAGVAAVDPDLATLVRTGVVFVALMALLAATAGWRSQGLSLGALDARSWLLLVLSGLATGASWLCWFRALKLGDAARVAPVDKLSVVLVALFGVLFLGERLGWYNWLGIALIAGGAALVALP